MDLNLAKEDIEQLKEYHRQESISMAIDLEKELESISDLDEYKEVADMYIDLMNTMRFNLVFFVADRLEQLKEIKESEPKNIVRFPVK